MVRGRRSLLLFVTLLVASACATAGSGERGPRYDRYEISHEEIQDMQGQVNNLYVLVNRLRPHWLTGNVVVYERQSLLGDAEYLGNLAPDYAYRLEYLDRSQAVASLPGLGSRRIDGAIMLHRTR